MSGVITIPRTWVTAKLEDVTAINPGQSDIKCIDDEIGVSFVPMRAVKEEVMKIFSPEVRELKDVRKGYTAFQNDDIIVAKITPCFENGKFALADSLENGLGFGSTEFHVIRPTYTVNPHYLWYFLIQSKFRYEGKRHMTGSAGQLRIPIAYLRQVKLPIPPLPEQHRIVDKLEQLFSRLDSATQSLNRAQALLSRYRQAVLKTAVTGELSHAWRQQHMHECEPASALLRRILATRRQQWESNELAKMVKKGKDPSDDKWKEKYPEPVNPDTKNLPELPEGWVWASLDQISHTVQYGSSIKSSENKTGIPIVRMGNIQDGELSFDKLKYLEISDEAIADLLLKPGDILFNRTNSAELVGKSAVFKGWSSITIRKY